MQQYDKIRGKIKTGDIILYSGKGAVSSGIRFGTGSEWSHVGMAMRIEGWDAVLCWESTTLNTVKDIELNRAVKGVQLVPLSERVIKYNGRIAIRHLEGVGLTDAIFENLKILRRQLIGRPYEKSTLELLNAALDLGDWTTNAEDLSSLFCSELVAEAYQTMGLLDSPPIGLPSNEYVPKDFSDQGNICLKQGNLSEEIVIKI